MLSSQCPTGVLCSSSYHDHHNIFNYDSDFILQADLHSHEKSVHEGKKPFKCTSCNAHFKVESDLKGHVETDHEGKKNSSV